MSRTSRPRDFSPVGVVRGERHARRLRSFFDRCHGGSCGGEKSGGMVERSGVQVTPRGSHRWAAALTLTANVSTAVVLGAVVLVLALAPRDSAFLYHPLGGVLVSVVLLAVGWWLVRLTRRLRIPSRRAVTLLALGLTLLSCVVAYHSEFYSNWDPKAIRSGALGLVQHGEIAPPYLNYFARYPNNLPLLLIAVPMVRFARATGLSFFDTVIIVNGLLFFGVCVLTAACLAALGRRRLIVPTLLLLTVLLGFYPYMTVFYSDLPGAFLCALLVRLCIQIRLHPERSYRVMCGVAVVCGVAYAIKPYVLVVPIAGVIVWLFSGSLGSCVRRWGLLGTTGRLLVLPALVLLVSQGEKMLAYRQAETSVSALKERRPPLPVLHWVALGVHDNGDVHPQRTYGGFDHGIYHRDAIILDPRKRDTVIREGIEADLRRQGVGGTALFLGKKISWVLGDGNFFGQKEGEDALVHPLRPGPISDLTLIGGRWYDVKAKFTQGVWGAVLMALIVGLVRRRRHSGLACLSLAFLGFVAYETLFEARPRYVIAILPMILVTLALGQGRDGEEPTSWMRTKRANSAGATPATCEAGRAGSNESART